MGRNDEAPPRHGQRSKTSQAGQAIDIQTTVKQCDCQTPCQSCRCQEHRARVATAITRFYDRQSGALPNPSPEKLDTEAGSYLALRFTGGPSDD